MQRATYLSQLYESIANIPPDIQQCLLTIAQYGCDPSQLDRWYGIVRQHYGVSWTEPAQDQAGLQYFHQVPSQPNPTHSSNSAPNNTSLVMLSPSVSPKLEEYADPSSTSNIAGGLHVAHYPAVDPLLSHPTHAADPGGRPLLPKSIPVTYVVASSAKRPSRIEKRRKAAKSAPRTSTQPPGRPSRPLLPYRSSDTRSCEPADPESSVLPFVALDEGLLLGQRWQLMAGAKNPSNGAESNQILTEFP